MRKDHLLIRIKSDISAHQSRLEKLALSRFYQIHPISTTRRSRFIYTKRLIKLKKHFPRFSPAVDPTLINYYRVHLLSVTGYFPRFFFRMFSPLFPSSAEKQHTHKRQPYTVSFFPQPHYTMAYTHTTHFNETNTRWGCGGKTFAQKVYWIIHKSRHFGAAPRE